MTTSMNSTEPFAVGEVVSGMVLRFDADSASFVLQLHNNVPAYISVYEVSDTELDLLVPGAKFEAIVDRVSNKDGHVSVVLRKEAQPIAA